MTDTAVAMGAAKGFKIGFPGSDQIMNHGIVTTQAIILKNAFVLRSHHNRLMKILQGKSFGVAVAVVGLRDVFRNHSLR